MPEIHKTAVIGKNLQLGDHVKIDAYTVIGDNVKIGNNVSMKPFCEIRDNCSIGNDVTFGSRCTLAEGTIVKDKVAIKYGFVATDTPKIGQAKRTPCIINEGSRFGANVTLMPGVIIGKNCEIGACSQVRHNIPDNEIWYGNPAQFYKNNNL